MKKSLLDFLVEDRFVSGEKLASNLGISRTAVWKKINSLRNFGYKIESIKNKGYLLVSRPDIPIPEEIKTGLDSKIIGRKIHYFKEINSTNLYAKKLVHEGTKEGTVVVADIQLTGRGRKDRTWSSPSGGLWFSIVLYPQLPPEKGMIVTMTASVAVAQAIKEITGLNPNIKWPNDILLDKKKVCGVLTEIEAEMDRINYSIIGIGINVNNEIEEDLKDIAISLKSIVGYQISRVKLLQSILKFLDENYEKLASKDNKIILETWLSFSNIIGREIQVNDEKEKISGIVIDVDESGCLILNTDKGQDRIVSGDITFL
jgi:BirA family biotin operon repressor/biotin-[acetyl-CoA-carboxylase] ligase